jgi:hypothetical protein
VTAREGSQISGLRQQWRPYLADADMTVVIGFAPSAPLKVEDVLNALQEPARPLFLGRTSCPPEVRLAGNIIEAENVVAAVKAAATKRSAKLIYLPTELVDPEWGDLPVSIPLGGPVIRPWAIHARRGPVLTIVGYSDQGADEVNARRALALPSLQASVGEALSVEMPPLEPDATYRFSVRLVPTIRVTPSEAKRYGERDSYLVAADAVGPDGALTRDEGYRDYLARKLVGSELDACRLDSFRLTRFVRPKSNGQATKTMPEASLSGVLRVSDPERLSQCLRSGVGRQRAYGYGMVRLQAARLSD